MTSEPPDYWGSFGAALVVADGRPIVQVRGEIDIATAPGLRRAIAEGQARESESGASMPVVVDFSGVTFMSASGIGVLVSSRRGGREIVLLDPSPCTTRVLALTGMLDVFPMEWTQPANRPAPNRHLARAG
jgi:anti-anti-sigma factor